MSAILTLLFAKVKGYLAAAVAGAVLVGSVLFATRKKTPDYSAQNAENKDANIISQTAQAETGERINAQSDKTDSAVSAVRGTDSLREQREVAAKAVDDANS